MATRVKICGITRVADAQLAATFGAYAIGMVFWDESPRVVDAAHAAALTQDLPAAVQRVGVFVDAQPGQVADVMRRVRLDVAQLHGAELLDGFLPIGIRLFKSTGLGSPAAFADALEMPDDVTPIVDACDPIRRGGTGRLADWAAAARLAVARPIILAGGLTPANVGEAIRQVRPWAVDVSSGVEDGPGVKSPRKLEQFFAAVAAADEGMP